uniref:Uncharacterized protein n=1 Tax=Lepeophtheirus salmonis TaxID=72036 RepID=A0A0K2TLZ0_LEPSM
MERLCERRYFFKLNNCKYIIWSL